MHTGRHWLLEVGIQLKRRLRLRKENLGEVRRPVEAIHGRVSFAVMLAGE